jgi:hypothetical protein
LRRATKDNPRNLPCRNCHAPDVLTPLDVAAGYQCDGCAVAREQDRDRDLVCGGSRKGCELCKNLEEE